MSAVAQVAKLEGRWVTAWHWLRGLRRRIQAKPEKLLRLSETLSLGERRFLAVVEFQQQKFLIGGTASSVCLLAELGLEHSGRISSKMLRPVEHQVEDVWP